MAKVTDIQDKNGATREIQDKDLANRTAASSIASSDYVLLEDTNGAYHKIAKASFTEAVRGALGSVINSVAKGTDIAKVPVLDSNNDLGMGTLSNLASVLGGHFNAIIRTITLAAGATHTESQIGIMASGLWQISESSSYGSAILFVNKHGSIVSIYQDTAGGMSKIVVAKTSAWEFTITNNNSSSVTIDLRKM